MRIMWWCGVVFGVGACNGLQDGLQGDQGLGLIDSGLPTEEVVDFEDLEVELPSNGVTLAYGYLLCVANDRAGSADLVVQQLEDAGWSWGDPQVPAVEFLESGYCDTLERDVDRIYPEVRARMTALAGNRGVDLEQPLEKQVDSAEVESVFDDLAGVLARLLDAGRTDEPPSKHIIRIVLPEVDDEVHVVIKGPTSIPEPPSAFAPDCPVCGD